MTLTTGNYDSFFRGIPVGDASFNQTFRDAFNVTMDLGYDYVWIDSLCIIQDSPGAEDWKRECPQVGYIYANGECNLSATGFRNGATGMSANRNPCPIQMPCRPTMYLVANTSPFLDPETELPLLSRGWVMQEHTLSPRTLHFLPNQICWVCRCSTHYELRSAPRFGDLELDHLHMSKKKFGAAGIALRNFSPSNEIRRRLQYWAAFSDKASSTNLTVISDRLPSLSGIASLLQPWLQSRYVAGHWEASLVETLAWQCDMQGDEAAYEGYIGPSWSWVSALRPVYSDHIQISRMQSPTLSQVLEVNITHAGADEFGPLRDAYLRLRGPALGEIREIYRDGIYLTGVVDLPSGLTTFFSVQLDRPTLAAAAPSQTYKGSPERQVVTPSLTWLKSLRWLLLCVDEDNQFSGLMLERVEHRSDGIFRRVGSFTQFMDGLYYVSPYLRRNKGVDPMALRLLPTDEYTII
ncbi:HET-domain-containing protein [Apiospora aurea]|uniref:HET-domain-containing protein n=1 Tax=Apiospora aurea TaxID=335848 RepID=A0ABR1QSP9_9PEZI